MQRDFFKLPAASSEEQKNARELAIKATKFPSAKGTEILDISNSKNLYSYKPDGKKVYQVRKY